MYKTHDKHLPLPDTHQTFWQLSAIQLSGWISLPILATSVLILQDNSFYGAMLTIIVGNAILWFIRLAIIGMSYKDRQSTLDISRAYLGRMANYFIGSLCLISTLAWFIAQTTAASSTLTNLILIKESPSIDKFTQISVVLGIVSTFFCMNGITVLRRLSTWCFPVLIVAFLIAIFTMPFHVPEASTTAISLSGLTLVLGTNLGITADLPTFFRHSKSFQTSITALTVIQLISLGLGLCSLYFGAILSSTFEINHEAVLAAHSSSLRIALTVLVIFSVICANVANVYSASVGWEVIAPKALVGRKEYLILGLGLTTVFILVSNIFSVKFLLDCSDSSLINLCLVLTFGFFISRLKKKSPSPQEQQIYFFAWLISTIVNTLQYSEVLSEHVSPLLMGLGVILSVFFIGYVLMAFFRRPKWLNL